MLLVYVCIRTKWSLLSLEHSNKNQTQTQTTLQPKQTGDNKPNQTRTHTYDNN